MGKEQQSAAAAARRLLAASSARERKNVAALAGSRKPTTAARVRKDATVGRSGKPTTAAPVRKDAMSQATGAIVGARSTAAPTFSASPWSTGCPSFLRTPRSTSSFSSSPSPMPSINLMTQAPWMHALSSDLTEWETDPVSAGGFTIFLQNHHQNSHLVGRTSHCAPFMPPWLMERSPSVEEITTTPPSRGNHNLNVDNELVGRTDKRLLWTPDEDLTLMSAWLKNSVDAIAGNDKRNEQYWSDVARTYNMSTPSHRQRNMKQVKDRWHKINKWVDLFHSAWLKARRLNTSGWNDQMWIDQAHKFYEEDNKELKLGHFVLMKVWYLVRDEAKWATYNDGLKESRKRKASGQGTEERMEEEDPFDVAKIPRPIGQKVAKKTTYESKRKSKPCANIDEEVEILKEAQANRLKVLEVQQKLSAERLLAAKEHKEAKIYIVPYFPS